MRETRLHLRLIALIGLMVPRRLRSDWREEWEAELRYREARLAEWDRLDARGKRELVWRSAGAFWDALHLLPRRWEDETVQDLRFGVRMLWRHKTFTVAAVVSLALGVGANTAIFQLIDAVRLRTLPVRAPQELVEIRPASMKGARGSFSANNPTVTNVLWEQIRQGQTAFSSTFSGTFAWGAMTVNLSPAGEIRPARMIYAGGSFFETLGVEPVLGRFFTADDGRRGCGGPGMVISYGFWQREYGGATDVLGRTVNLGGHAFPILGVTPSSFFGLEVGRSFDMALPLCANALVRGNARMLESGSMWWLTAMGRLKPDVSLEQADAQVRAMSAGIFAATLQPGYPANSVQDYLNTKLMAAPAGAGVSRLRQRYESSLYLLLAIAGCVLLIACVNLANLLLARASARQRELAVRQSMGATRGRLVRQLLSESLLLAMLGSGAGVALAPALSRLLVAMIGTSENPVFLNIAMDWRVLCFAASLALVTGLVFGLLPALSGSRPVQRTRGSTAGREGLAVRRTLAVVQIALSLVLVTGAVLFSRTLVNLQKAEAGFRAEGLLVTTALFEKLNLPQERHRSFRDELVQTLRAIPGVESAAILHEVPMRDSGSNTMWMDGETAREGRAARRARIGPGYFRTLEIPLLAGRDFDARDRMGSPRVAIVNEAFARMFAGGSNPVGRRVHVEPTPGEAETVYEIVGVVRNTKVRSMRDEFQPIFYDASAQEPAGPGLQVVLRSSMSAGEAMTAVKRAMGDAHPALQLSFVSLPSLIESTLLRERLIATLAALFGLLALTLACVGLYGLLSFHVAERTSEIGIRMALGASRGRVFWWIQREGLVLVLTGVLVGSPLLWAATRGAEAMLYGLTPQDPMSLGAGVLLMLVVALLSGYLPSRGAANVDPMVALRAE